jgi:hypothetical protein
MFHSARSFDPPDERGNFEKVDKNIIVRCFVLVRVDEATIGNGGDAHVCSFAGGDAGERIFNHETFVRRQAELFGGGRCRDVVCRLRFRRR